MVTTERYEAFMQMNRQDLINVICRSGYIFPVEPNQQGLYLFGRTRNERAVCLVSRDTNNGSINREIFSEIARELKQSGLQVPFLCFGYSSLYSSPDLFTFAQIPWCFEQRNNSILRILQGMNMRGNLHVLQSL